MQGTVLVETNLTSSNFFQKYLTGYFCISMLHATQGIICQFHSSMRSGIAQHKEQSLNCTMDALSVYLRCDFALIWSSLSLHGLVIQRTRIHYRWVWNHSRRGTFVLPETRGEAHSAASRAGDRAPPVCTQLDPAGVGTASNWKPSLTQAALRTVPRCGLGERERWHGQKCGQRDLRQEHCLPKDSCRSGDWDVLFDFYVEEELD